MFRWVGFFVCQSRAICLIFPSILFVFYFVLIPVIDGYINEAGTLNTRRLQQVLDEMTIWERDVFEREYADANWYKGKQRKYVEGREVAEARGRASLGESLVLVVIMYPNPGLVSRSSDETSTCDI